MLEPLKDFYQRLQTSSRQRVRARLWGNQAAQDRLREILPGWMGPTQPEEIFRGLATEPLLKDLEHPLRMALTYEEDRGDRVPDPEATASTLVRALQEALDELKERERGMPPVEVPPWPEAEPGSLHPAGVAPRQMSLVISGGGAKGAFAVGALSYLVVEGELRFGTVVGTSTGALIAPMVVTGEMAELIHLYERVTTRDIIRKRFFVFALFKGSLYSTRPLKELIDRYLTDPQRWQRLTALDAMTMFVSTVDMQTGDIVYGSNRSEEDTANRGENLRKKILASASEPVLMPLVDVPHTRRDGRRYLDQFVDGGVKELAPFRKAIESGALRILGLLLQPAPEQRTPVARLHGFKDIAERTVSLFIAEVGDNDEGTACLINRVRVLIETVRDNARRQGIDPATLFAGTDRPFGRYRILGITLVRPDRELGPALRFEPPVMKAWMDLGYRTAIRTAHRAWSRRDREVNCFTSCPAE